MLGVGAILACNQWIWGSGDPGGNDGREGIASGTDLGFSFKKNNKGEGHVGERCYWRIWGGWDPGENDGRDDIASGTDLGLFLKGRGIYTLTRHIWDSPLE